MSDVLSLAETLDRVERIVRGEDIAERVIIAGEIPYYYATDSTSVVCARWLDMAARVYPRDEWFYLSNAIGWASRD